MKFDEKSTKFGGHETFPLRFSWLPKGYQAVVKNPRIFFDEDATVVLGVGKNMVASIRHWMRATQILDPEELKLSSIGHYLFDESTGVDPYLEDEATIWLIHWLLCSNPKKATSWFLFFNEFHKYEFTSEEALRNLLEFVKANEIKTSPATLKNDIAVLTRMYSAYELGTKSFLDETLDAPMSLLGLLNKTTTKSFISETSTREDLPLGIFGFAVAQAVNAWVSDTSKGTVLVENLFYSRDGLASPGAIFRLSESGFMKKLEVLQEKFPSIFEINESAGISQLYLSNNTKSMNPMNFLDFHYNGDK